MCFGLCNESPYVLRVSRLALSPEGLQLTSLGQFNLCSNCSSNCSSNFEPSEPPLQSLFLPETPLYPGPGPRWTRTSGS